MSAGADARGVERIPLPWCVQGGASTSTAGVRPNGQWGCLSGTGTIRADALHIHTA